MILQRKRLKSEGLRNKYDVKLIVDCVNCKNITNNIAGTLSLPVTRSST